MLSSEAEGWVVDDGAAVASAVEVTAVDRVMLLGVEGSGVDFVLLGA
jgi:hypothetical protein